MSKLRANTQVMVGTITRELIDTGFEQDLVKIAQDIAANDDDILALQQDKADISYVDTRFTELVGGAPEALDTLNELAAALADDANYAATVTAALAGHDSRIKAIENDTTRIKEEDFVKGENLSAQVDGSATTFTFAKKARVGTVEVFLNGLAVYEDTVAVDEATKTLTFTTAPNADDKVRVSYLAVRDVA